MGVVKLSNVHVNTDEKRPDGRSELEIVLGIVRHWHTFREDVRESIIREKCSGMFAATEGILGSVLNGLEQVDPDKLAAEVRAALDKEAHA